MSNVARIKERLGISDVIGNYLKLEKAGSQIKAKCPFHSEKTPSFFISPDRGTYYCFGCGAKGDIFTFIQEFEGLDFLGALKMLATHAGITLEFESQREKSERERLFELMEEAVTFFERNLAAQKEALHYVKKRGLQEETIKSWRIGFAEDAWQSFTHYAKGKGFTNEELIATGLAKKSQKKKGEIYDVFRGRIMFPIFDTASRVIAFSGRILKDTKDAPKYLNSPETVLFNKSEVLYGFDKAKQEIRNKNYSVLVEGQIDLVLSHQAGFKNTVATSGTALTIFQLQKLNRLSSRIILAYDGDSAGFRALEKGAKMALAIGMNVGIATLPLGEDPASVIEKDPETWKTILKQSSHIINFFLEKIVQSSLIGRLRDQEIKKRVLPFVALVPSAIEQSRFIAEIAEKTGIREEAIREDLKKVSTKEFVETRQTAFVKEAESRKSNIIKRLVGIVFWQDQGKEKSEVDIVAIKSRLEALTEKQIFEQWENKKDELIFEVEAYFSGVALLHTVVEDLFLNLEEELLKNKFVELMNQLSLLEKKGEKTTDILNQCKEISQKINALKARKGK